MTTDVSVGVRWDPLNPQAGNEQGGEDFEFDYDGGNSSSRLFERSRIKALAGTSVIYIYLRVKFAHLETACTLRSCLNGKMPFAVHPIRKHAKTESGNLDKISVGVVLVAEFRQSVSSSSQLVRIKRRALSLTPTPMIKS